MADMERHIAEADGDRLDDERAGAELRIGRALARGEDGETERRGVARPGERVELGQAEAADAHPRSDGERRFAGIDLCPELGRVGVLALRQRMLRSDEGEPVEAGAHEIGRQVDLGRDRGLRALERKLRDGAAGELDRELRTIALERDRAGRLEPEHEAAYLGAR